MLTIILPVYNESESIIECLNRLYRAVEQTEHEIVVCYDYDEDTTLPILNDIKHDFPTMRLVKNEYGKGAAHAIRAGIESARGSIIVTTMADLSDPPEIIPEMKCKIEEGAWVVSASRYIPGGSIKGAPFLKEKLSMLAGLFLFLVTGIRTRDVTNNFRAYKRELFNHIQIESKHGFEIGLELTVKAFRLGFPIGEVPSQWEERQYGETKFKLFKWLPFYLQWFFYGLAPTMLYWLTIFLLFFVHMFMGLPILLNYLLFVTTVVFLVLRHRGLREPDVLSAIVLMNPLLVLLEENIPRMGFLLSSLVGIGIILYEFKQRKVPLVGVEKEKA